MILDHIDNHRSYTTLHPLFPEAFRHLGQLAGAEALPEGRIDLEGGRMHAVAFHGPGRSRAAARLEAHRQYIDIQYTVAGQDSIGWRPLGECTQALGYDEAKDVEFFGDTASQWIDVPTAHFVIFYPEDVHAPLAGGETLLRKIVIKVPVLAS